MHQEKPNKKKSTVTRKAKGSYWEKEREMLVSALEERIAKNKDSVSLAELLQQNIPDLIKVVLRKHAKNLVRKEKPFVIQTLRQYQLDDSELRHQLHVLQDMLVERIIFDRLELKPILNFAVSLQFDVIVKPRAALENILYRKSNERERGDIVTILRGLGEERNYISQLLSKVLGNPDGLVKKEVFVALCRQAEKEIYRKNFTAALIADFKDYQGYCKKIIGSRLSEEDDPKLDNQVILSMMYERDLTELAESLLPEITQKETWKIRDVKALIRDYIETANTDSSIKETLDDTHEKNKVNLNEFWEEAVNEFTNQLVQSETGHETQEVTSDELEESQQQKNIKDEQPQLETDAKQELEITTGNMTGLAEDVSETASPKPRQKNKQTKLENMIIYRSDLEKQPAGPFPSLTRVIDVRTRKAIVKKIFQKDIDGYLEFIERLENTLTWKEAKHLLDSELNKRKVNPYSKEAVRFSDLLFGRYFSKL